MKLDGDQLRLKLSEKVDALYEAKDAHNAEILKAAITQEDVSVDISDIPENKRYIAVKKGNLFIPVYKEKKKRIFVENQKNQLVEETSGNHRCYLLNRKAVIALLTAGAYAQGGDGIAGITEATSMVTSYFYPLVQLIYAIGAVTGLIGGIRVYQKFSSGDPDTSKTAASWFGACIFLILVGTVLESFFF